MVAEPLVKMTTSKYFLWHLEAYCTSSYLGQVWYRLKLPLQIAPIQPEALQMYVFLSTISINLHKLLSLSVFGNLLVAFRSVVFLDNNNSDALIELSCLHHCERETINNQPLFIFHCLIQVMWKLKIKHKWVLFTF